MSCWIPIRASQNMNGQFLWSLFQVKLCYVILAELDIIPVECDIILIERNIIPVVLSMIFIELSIYSVNISL